MLLTSFGPRVCAVAISTVSSSRPYTCLNIPISNHDLSPHFFLTSNNQLKPNFFEKWTHKHLSDKNYLKCIWHVLWSFSLTHVPSANMEGAGYINNTAASHQGAIEMFWFVLFIFILQYVFVIDRWYPWLHFRRLSLFDGKWLIIYLYLSFSS